jgi:teichuronic acid exporter
MSNADLDRSLLRGLGWTAISRWVGQIISWGATFYAARRLTPGDYGLVAMATVPIGLVRMIEDFGLDAVVVQNRLLARTEIAQLGGLAVLLATALIGALVVAAPTLASFFGEPTLATLIAIASAVIIFDALQVVPRALLQRELRFKALALVYLAQVAATSIALVLAARAGLREWALVLNNLSGALVATVLLFAICPIMLRWPQNLGQLRQPLLQGWRMLMSRAAWYGYSNIDQTAIGRFLGRDALGNYSFAQTFSNTAVQEVTALVTRVVPGVFSSAQNDKPALRRYFLLLTEVLAFVTFPMCIGVLLTADTLVLAALGPQWTGVVAPLRALCLYTALGAAQILASHILLWTGRFRANMWLSLLALIVIPLAVLVGVQYGTTAVAWALVIGFPLASLPGVYLALRAIELPWLAYGRALWPALSSCIIMSIVVFAVRPLVDTWPPLFALGAQAASGALTYIAAVWLLHRARVRDLYAFMQRARAA